MASRENKISKSYLKNEIGNEFHYLFNSNDSFILQFRVFL